MEARPYEHMRNGGSEMLCYGMRREMEGTVSTVPCVTQYGERPMVAPTVRCRGDERSECLFKTV